MVDGIKTQQRKMMLLLLGVDAIILLAAIYASYYIRFGVLIHVLKSQTGASLFTLFVCLSCFYIFDLYELSGGVRRANFAVRFLLAVGLSASVLPLMFYSLPLWKFSRGTLLYTVIMFSGVSLFWRVLFEGYFMRIIGDNRTVLVGSSGLGGEVAGMLSETPGFNVKSRLDENGPATAEALLHMARNGLVDSITVDLAAAKGAGLLPVLLECKVMKVDIFDMSDMYESLTGKVPVKELDERRLVSEQFSGMRRNVYMSRLKRFSDIGLAAAGLLATFPVSLVSAALVKLTSRGPVFFRQSRVGLNGREFEILKFRSMKMDAEDKGAVWAMEDDPRVTAVGWFLRKTRVDEIPQMWNVLKGDMSFIGPRPERPEFVSGLNEAIPFYQIRHIVKPGITGWAQINYRYGASQEDALKKLQYDLYYIKNLGLMIDLQILFKTVKVILFGAGAR
jgi:exopolysaccharide biosynthesis polyprenyl glycosylphosphotransferase